MKPYKKHQKCIYFAEQVREFVNPKYKESSHTTGQTVRQLVIDWEKLRRQFDGFAFVWNMKKGNQKMRPIINRQWRGWLEVFVFALKICPRRLKGFVIPLEFKNHKSTMKWKERKSSKKRRLGAALSFHLITNLAEVFCEERKTRKEDPQRFTKSSMDMPVHWECKIWLLWSWCLCLFIWKCKMRRKRRGEFSESQIGNYRSRQSEFFFALEIKKGRLCIWERDQQLVQQFVVCEPVNDCTMHNMLLCNYSTIHYA